MKSKILIVFSTLALALAMMAQSTTPTTPAPSDNAKSCACCNHDQADGKMACSGKDGACCGKDAAGCKDGSCCQGKDGKACSMMSKDQNGKMTCCAGGKCPMMSKEKGKSCCGGKMCERPQSGA
ncbi:MAG: hypothetical protein WA655_21040 [Candidatus Korobacteraceae bacterium]